MRDEPVNIFCPHYHIKYNKKKCGGLLRFLTRRWFNSEYECTRCGERVALVEGMSYDEIQYLKNNKQNSGVRERRT